MSTSLTSAEKSTTTRYNVVAVFWVFVAVSIFISGILAAYCLHKGGNLAWSTRFGVWVQVACKFR